MGILSEEENADSVYQCFIKNTEPDCFVFKTENMLDKWIVR